MKQFRTAKNRSSGRMAGSSPYNSGRHDDWIL